MLEGSRSWCCSPFGFRILVRGWRANFWWTLAWEASAGGCQRGAITAISFAYAATAVVGGIGAAVFLLWSETWLTLLVLVFAGFAALFLYPLTLRAAKSAKNA